MSAARSILGRLAVVIAGVSAAAALVAQGGRVSPQLDVLTHFAPFYALGGALAILLAFAARRARRVSIMLGLVAAAAALGLIAPELLRPLGPTARDDAPGQIKIIQINARRTNANIGPIVSWLIAQDPDIVTITEARHDLRDLLKARTGWAVAGRSGDLMIFTRAPRVAMNRPPLLYPTELNFVNATYPHPSGQYEVVTARYSWPVQGHQIVQRAALARILRQLPRDRMILTGDFNLTPWSFAMRRMDERLGLIRRTRGVATFPAMLGGGRWPLPVLPIDHVYAGPGWAVVSVERGPYLGSDHYPVVVTLAPVSPR